jgi:hypothetical protein
MSKVVVDAALRARLHNLAGLLEVCDESGQILGYFHPVAVWNAAEGCAQSPIPREEIERRRQQRSGRPLADILKGLQGS